MSAPIKFVATTVSKQALWFASRGMGVVALLFLTVSVVLGIMTSVRFESPRWPRFVVEGLHRNLSLAILIFITIHIVTTVADGFAPIGYLDAIIPGQSPYRTVWLGLGAVALDMLLALTISSLIRVRLGYNVWRIVHWLAYACWPVALMHGLGTGSDTRTSWMQAINALVVIAVVTSIAWRVRVGWPQMQRARVYVVGALVVVPLCVGAWATSGPLRSNWSHTFRPPKHNVTVTSVPTSSNGQVSK